MNIKSLYIKDYNILQDFRINFNSNLSVIIGENGSGKSSIIECLAYIFGHLHKYFVLGDKTSGFIEYYEIEYMINGYNVYIKSKHADSKDDTFDPIIKINGEIVSKRQLTSKYDGFTSFLPTKVVLSYAGITDRLMQLHKHFEDKFIKSIIRSDNPYSLIPLTLPNDNPFMYIKKEYVAYIVLALFVLDSEDGNTILENLGIDIHGCTTKIVLKKPHWSKSNKNDKEGTLWGISGKIATDFIKGLDVIGIQSESTEDDADSTLTRTYEFYGNMMVKDLFGEHFHLQADQVVSFLDTLLCDDLLGKIEVIWNDNFSLDKLSEGEKQLILSIGMSRVLSHDNILFLLDEPDASLHPKWQQKFVGNLDKELGEKSMAIVTTHNPILIGNLQNEQVSELRMGKVLQQTKFSFGRDINSLLQDYFEVNERNEEGKKLISEFYNSMNQKNYEQAEMNLQKLKNSFGPEDITTIKADSLFDDLAE